MNAENFKYGRKPWKKKRVKNNKKTAQNDNENSQNGREDTIKIIEIKYRNKIEETSEMMEMIISGVFIKVKSKVKKCRMELIGKKCANINIAHAKH